MSSDKVVSTTALYIHNSEHVFSPRVHGGLHMKLFATSNEVVGEKNNFFVQCHFPLLMDHL